MNVFEWKWFEYKTKIYNSNKISILLNDNDTTMNSKSNRFKDSKFVKSSINNNARTWEIFTNEKITSNLSELSELTLEKFNDASLNKFSIKMFMWNK